LLISATNKQSIKKEATVSQRTHLNLFRPCDPAIPLLGMDPKKWKSVYNRDSFIPMFIAALFTIARLWIILNAQQPMNG
jgi:hypothetical protein